MNIKTNNTSHIFNIHEEGIPFLSFDMLDALGVPNMYTTRFTSFASGACQKGLRLALMSDESWDEARPIIYNNLKTLVNQVGASIDKECVTYQKHTNIVHTVTKSDLGFENMSSREIPIDGLVTNIPGAVLLAYGADCPPVYIADPVRKVVGLVHAGWRGTLGRIPAVAIEKMIGEFDCKPEDMYAAVGIGICQDCYEMGDEVFDAFAKEWSEEDAKQIMKRYPAQIAAANLDADGNANGNAAGNANVNANADKNASNYGKYHLDLIKANKMTLLRAGVPEEHISVSNICTCCNSDVFYSYRAKKMENEQAAILVNRFDK